MMRVYVATDHGLRFEAVTEDGMTWTATGSFRTVGLGSRDPHTRILNGAEMMGELVRHLGAAEAQAFLKGALAQRDESATLTGHAEASAELP